MSFLGQREPHTATDDVEAQAASYHDGEGSSTTQSPGGSGSAAGGGSAGEHIKFGESKFEPAGGGSDLGEYEKLDRFITNYDLERRASMATGSSRSRKKPKWWQFWKSSAGEPAAAPHPTERGKPPEAWLETDIRNGLTDAEVGERRARFGWNELTAEKDNMFQKVLGYFQGPILYGMFVADVFCERYGVWDGLLTAIPEVMELAALLAVGLGDWIDFGVILGILALNAFVGFYQEKQAADVVASLKGDIAMKAYAIRNGGEQQVLARELVPGDIVREPSVIQRWNEVRTKPS